MLESNTHKKNPQSCFIYYKLQCSRWYQCIIHDHTCVFNCVCRIILMYRKRLKFCSRMPWECGVAISRALQEIFHKHFTVNSMIPKLIIYYIFCRWLIKYYKSFWKVNIAETFFFKRVRRLLRNYGMDMT